MFFVRLTYALWAAAVTYLTVTAFGAKRDAQPHLVQSFGLMFGMIGAFVLPRWRPLRFVNFAPVNPVLSVMGVATMLFGMGWLVWGRQTLGSNWSQTVSAKEGGELITSGPYRFVRHPMYAGGILACLASALVVGGPFVFLALILTPLFVWRVSAEDELMLRQFPGEYPSYMQRTNRLIPLVW